MRRRVILLGDERKPGVREAVKRARGWIPATAELVAVDLSGTLDVRGLDADLAVIFGGDGSILAAARRMGDRPIPTIGVNFGKFGFLTDIRARDVERELGRVISGDYEVGERLVLRGRVSGEAVEHLALNDFYIGPGTVGRVVTVELWLDGEHATTYRGDGIVVATPTGSTGHSLSAGGPIVDPDLEVILLTPVSPHSLTNRPLVIPPDVTVELKPQRDHTDPPATCTVDGQAAVSMAPGDVLRVRRAAHRFPLVRSGRRTRYEVLRSRLGWSGQPPFENDAAETA